MTKKNIAKRAPDDLAGEAAFQSIEPVLRAMGADQILSANIDPSDAALAALALVDVAREPRRAARLRELPPTLFPADTVDALELSAFATWYLSGKVQTETAGSTGVRVDAALMDASGVHLARMLKLVDYHKGDDPAVAAELADIRAGRGYQDRAHDLTRAAELFERHEAELKDDRRNYDRGAPAQARSYAQAILQGLRGSLGNTAAEWADLRARAFTRMVRLYNSLRAAGEFVFRDEPEHRDLIVPLRQAVVPYASRRAAEPASEEAGDAGAGGAVPEV